MERLLARLGRHAPEAASSSQTGWCSSYAEKVTNKCFINRLNADTTYYADTLLICVIISYNIACVFHEYAF